MHAPDRAGSNGDEAPVIEAARRPLVTYSGGSERAWAAKIEGDSWPAPKKPSQLPRLAAALAASVFLAAFFGAREAAVAALPDLAGLYAAIGLPVNLDDLVVEDLAAARGAGGDGGRLTVRGVIRNVGATEQAAPALTASVYDSARTAAGWRGFDPPGRMIAPGEAAPFHLEIDGVPRQAASVAIRFRRAADHAAAPPEGGAATP